MKNKKDRIYLICAMVCAALIVLCVTIKIIEKVNLNRLFDEYCVLPEYSSIETDSIYDCIELLISTEDLKNEQIKLIKNDYSAYSSKTKEKNQLLMAELDDRYSEYRLQIIQGCKALVDYASEDVLLTYQDNASRIKYISSNFHEKDYGYAFESFINLNSEYTENCVYYLILESYPEVFSQGIKEALLNIGTSTWSTSDEEDLNSILRYIDSLPTGRSGYTNDIETARKQLKAQNAKRQSQKKTTTDVPYYGMDEDRINSTGLGKCDKSELCRDYYALRPDHRSITYYWYDSSGNVMFKARSYAGEIISTVDYRSGKPKFDSPSDHH